MTNRIQALQQTALFGSLEMSDLEALSSRTVEHTLKKGEILFIAGDAATGLYVVVNGAIRPIASAPMDASKSFTSSDPARPWQKCLYSMEVPIPRRPPPMKIPRCYSSARNMS